MQASDSGFPPHPEILYLSPFNLPWSWISSRSCQPLCTTSDTWLAARRSPCQGPGGLCSVKGSIAEFTKQARQTATHFLIYAGTGTGGVALGCHSGVSIHCCLAAKVLLLLGIHETALYLQKRGQNDRRPTYRRTLQYQRPGPYQEPEMRVILNWHKTTLLLASPLPVSVSDDTASCSTQGCRHLILTLE